MHSSHLSLWFKHPTAYPGKIHLTGGIQITILKHNFPCTSRHVTVGYDTASHSQKVKKLGLIKIANTLQTSPEQPVQPMITSNQTEKNAKDPGAVHMCGHEDTKSSH